MTRRRVVSREASLRADRRDSWLGLGQRSPGQVSDPSPVSEAIARRRVVLRRPYGAEPTPGGGRSYRLACGGRTGPTLAYSYRSKTAAVAFMRRLWSTCSFTH